MSWANWLYKRDIILVNKTSNTYTNLISNLQLPAGFDYTGFKTNGEDIRFVIWEDNQSKELDYWIKRWGKGIPKTSLTIAVDDITTTIPANTINYPNFGVILIENEKIYYESKTDSNFLNCIRGYEDTIASSHVIGSDINYSGCIYIKIPRIIGNQSMKIDMYFGNADALSKSDKKNVGIVKTFENFDEILDFQVIKASQYGYTNQTIYSHKSEEGGKLYLVTMFNNQIAGLLAYNPALVTNVPSFYETVLTGRDGYLNKTVAISDKAFTYPLGFDYTNGFFVIYFWNAKFSQYQIYIMENCLLKKIWENCPAISKITIRMFIEPSVKKVIVEVAERDTVTGLDDSYPKDKILYRYIGNYSGEPNLFAFGDIAEYAHYTTKYLYAEDITIFQFLPKEVTCSLKTLEVKTTDTEWSNIINTNVSTNPYQILNFGDVSGGKDYFIFINKDEDILKWDGVAITKLPGNKKCKLGLVHKNRLWLFNFSELNEPSMVWYSNINKIDTIPDWQTEEIDNKFYINRSDGFEITAVGIMSDNIVVFKENAGYLIYGEIPDISPVALNINNGCIAWRSVAEWENGLFYVSKEGVHFIRGRTAEKPIAFSVDDITSDNLAKKILSIFNNLNKDYLKDAIGCVWNNRYYCAVPYHSSKQNDIILVLDYNAGWWSKWIPPSPISSMFVDPIDNVFFLGTVNGYIRLQETRNFAMNENLKEDGKDIPSYYETGYLSLNAPQSRKRLRQIDMLFNGKISLDINVDGREVSLGTFEGDKNILNRKNIKLLEIGNFFKLKFKNFTKQIHSITLLYDYMRT